MIFSKQQSVTLSSRISAVDEEIAAGNVAIEKLRSRRRDAIIKGDDAARTVIEDEITKAEREAMLRCERREILATEQEAALARDAREEFARRHAGQEEANAKAAVSVQKALRRAWDILAPALRELADAREATNLLNRAAPDGFSQLVHADDLARGSPALPRAEISSKQVEQWVFLSTGNRVGNQDDVQGGILSVGAYAQPQRCEKRSFRHVRFHPAQDARYAGPISSDLRFPRWDGVGLLFDGSSVLPDAVSTALIEVNQSGKASRPILEEFIPTANEASDAA